MDSKNTAGYTKRKRKTYDQLTLADDFLFGKIMQKPEICKQVLERILGRRITSISYSESQHAIDVTYDGKGVRLDIFVKDDTDTYYDMEMQRRDTREIPKRTRYYTSVIDQELIERGEAYYDLSDVVVIFICPFDFFGAGRAKYVIQSYEDSEEHRLFPDGCTRIILNTKGKADTKELQSFLDYLEGKKNLQDPLVLKLQKEERLASGNSEWRADYMKLQARDMDQRKIGRQEGIWESIRNLIANNIPAEEIKKLLKVTDEDIRMAQKK